MLKLKSTPIKIDHDRKIVIMTEQQVADNKYQLVKENPSGYKTKSDDYAVRMVLQVGKYAFPYTVLMDILWQAIRGYQIMYYTHCMAEEIKAMVARVYHIHQLLIPDAAGMFVPPPVNFSDMLADSEGLTLLKEVIAMSDEDREALVQHDREEGLKAYPGADKIVIEGEDITVRELAYFIHTGCHFLLFDAVTTTRKERASILYQEAIPGMLFSYILDGESEADAIYLTVKDTGFTKDYVEKVANMLIV